MDLLDNITMTSLLILYNINPLLLAIYASTLFADLEQQGLGVEEELHEVDTFVPARRKKNKKKAAHMVVIREVTMRVNNDNLLVSRSS
jgi:hypothetical protein